MPRDVYQSPFSTRYASREMQHLFSEEHKFRTWRRLWVALAEAEQAEGLAITDGQIAELKAHINDVNYEDAMRREAQCRHDVMSHVYAYGLQCPGAKGIIHLGATSCYVGDNTDLLIMRDALALLHKKLLSTMQLLADFAQRYAALPALAYTHYQPAQLTTVGKRKTCPFWAARAPRAHRPAFWSCLTATRPRRTRWTRALPRPLDFRARCPCAAKHTAASGTPWWQTC